MAASASTKVQLHPLLLCCVWDGVSDVSAVARGVHPTLECGLSLMKTHKVKGPMARAAHGNVVLYGGVLLCSQGCRVLRLLFPKEGPEGDTTHDAV